jgi:hypothetical protein
MKYLPWVLAGVHAAVTVWLFGAAILSPERSGLLPVILYVADYPCSIVLNWLRNLLHPDWSVESNLLIDGVVFLTLGSTWFYLIGLGVRSILRRLLGRLQTH